METLHAVHVVQRRWLTYIPDNFRGIAPLTVRLKLFTSIIYQRLLAYIEKKGILSEQQNGFRPGSSVFEHLRVLTNIIEDAKTNKKELHAGFIDFRTLLAL